MVVEELKNARNWVKNQEKDGSIKLFNGKSLNIMVDYKIFSIDRNEIKVREFEEYGQSTKTISLSQMSAEELVDILLKQL